MAEFENPKQFEAWLQDKPRAWAVSLAARAALRVLPLAEREYRRAKGNRALIVPLFCISAITLAAGKRPAMAMELRLAYADAADSAIDAYDDAVYAAATAAAAEAAAAAFAAARSVAAIFRNAATDAADAAAAAASAAAAFADRSAAFAAAVGAFASAAAGANWKALSTDATALEVRWQSFDAAGKAAILAGQPLWLDGAPPKAISHAWFDLSQRLRENPAEGWDIWIEWYEDLLAGRAPWSVHARHGEDLAMKVALQSNEDWDQPPAELNARIRRWVEEARAAQKAEADDSPDDPPEVPAQDALGLQFAAEVGEPLRLVEPVGEGLNLSDDQRDAHADIRAKAMALREACGQSNRLAALRGAGDRILDTMGEALDDLRLRSFWSAMNSLRRRLEADVRARQAGDAESPPLPEEVAGHLADLVDDLNVFAAHEPGLVRLDEARVDPAQRAAFADAVPAAGKLAEAAAGAPKVVEPKAAEALQQVAADAVGDTPSAERAKRFSVRSAGNLVLGVFGSVLGWAKRQPADASKAVLGEIYKKGTKAVLEWIEANQQTIINLFFGTSLESTITRLVAYGGILLKLLA